MEPRPFPNPGSRSFPICTGSFILARRQFVCAPVVPSLSLAISPLARTLTNSISSAAATVGNNADGAKPSAASPQWLLYPLRARRRRRSRCRGGRGASRAHGEGEPGASMGASTSIANFPWLGELQPAHGWLWSCGVARWMRSFRWTPEPRHQKVLQPLATCNSSCLTAWVVGSLFFQRSAAAHNCRARES